MAIESDRVAQTVLPDWRGFNLVDFEYPTEPDASFEATTEDDFRWISDWGFNFVRLPMAYPRWLDYDPSKPITVDQVYDVKDSALEEIDRLVELGRKYSVHVSLNFHRGPGFCINPGFREPFDLWRDQEAQDAFCFHWAIFARRYRSLSPKEISFNLLNEPCVWDQNEPLATKLAVPDEIFRTVNEAAVKAIREFNPEHLVICDGNRAGRIPSRTLEDLGVAQSCRSYSPVPLTHYDVPWQVSEEPFPEPVWPGVRGDGKWDDAGIWDRRRLEQEFAPWIELARRGIGVHCGECGCFSRTPHTVFLSWFRDVLDILKGAGIGFALWNFRGAFGVLDTGRTDVAYEDWHGHQLDRQLLDLMLA